MRNQIRADGSILICLLSVAAGAFLMGGSLYWSLRPTVVPNPSVNAYRPPGVPSILPRKNDDPDEAERLRLSIATAKKENDLLGLDATSAFAAAVPAQ